MRLNLPSGISPRGTVELPPSKSMANRLLIMSALTGEETTLQRANHEPIDVVRLRRLLKGQSQGYDVGMAGTACRFLCAYLTLKPGRHILTGDHRMLERPIKPLVDALQSLGAEIEYLLDNDYLPLAITGGKIKGGTVEIPGNVSSQYISALLMIAPYLKGGLKIKVTGDFYSEPYVQMTVELMRQSGVEVIQQDNEFKVPQGKYLHIPESVEGDWSAGSYFYSLVALAKGGDIQINGLSRNSLQGDAQCAAIFKKFGVQSRFNKEGVRLTYDPGKVLPGEFKMDCRDVPDLVQTLACTCAGLKIPMWLSGVRSLRVKETDRLNALQIELKKLGAEVHVGDDSLSLVSYAEPITRTVRTYNDHRMAMAFAPLSVLHPRLKIRDAEVVKKSFPDFWNQLIPLFE